ncbi:MAG: radical SAM protein [Oscillospiraceae bacterium]|nr:radical SAM protein [Oscillospiraceae bacterium]
MHYVTAKGILSSQNGMNIYRGCEHGCIYCDSRSLCYQMNHRFEDIEVKENALELLEAALKRKRKTCMLGTGVMSDPYTPLEKRLRMTRGFLELALQYGFGATVLTKSDLILRDLDLLKAIHEKARVVVQMSLTTCDDGLSRILEPNVCTTTRRAEVLRILQQEGIPTVVWMSPVVPGLTDTPENITGIVEHCARAGVKGIIHFGMGLTLRDGNREYFYRNLDRFFPGLKQWYIQMYGNSYELPSPREEELEGLFQNLCTEYGIWQDNEKIFAYLSSFADVQDMGQLSFFG